MSDERRLVPLADIKPEPVDWLWDGRFPRKSITDLIGDPGEGKSTLLYDIAARTTTGRPMPFGDKSKAAAGVVLLQAEDNLADVVKPSLLAAGVDEQRVRIFDRQRFAECPLIIPNDISVIEAAVCEIAASLLVIDPFPAFASCTNSDTAVHKTLAPLAALAQRRNLAIVIVRHLPKQRATNALYCGAGSIAISGNVRSGFWAAKDPDSDDPFVHVLAQTKRSLATVGSLTFRTVMRDGAKHIEWLGPSNWTADELASATGVDHSALQEAAYILYSLLSNGPLWAQEVFKLTVAQGVSRRTLSRAKALLGVRPRKRGYGRESRWFWALPEDESLLRPFKKRDHDEIMDRLCHGDATPAPPGSDPKQDDQRRDGDGGLASGFR